MKKTTCLYSLLLLVACTCRGQIIPWENKDFKIAIDDYCKYIDSNTYRNKFDYIYVEAIQKNDSIIFVIYLDGGAYSFLEENEKIIDFFNYNKYDVLLFGDFPNEIVNIQKNRNLKIIDDIVKVRYPDDYDRYMQKKAVGPEIYDFMNMTLVFKKGKLISCKKQYY